jgi:hypothetical protein
MPSFVSQIIVRVLIQGTIELISSKIKIKIAFYFKVVSKNECCVLLFFPILHMEQVPISLLTSPFLYKYATLYIMKTILIKIDINPKPTISKLIPILRIWILLVTMHKELSTTLVSHYTSWRHAKALPKKLKIKLLIGQPYFMMYRLKAQILISWLKKMICLLASYLLFFNCIPNRKIIIGLSSN